MRSILKNAHTQREISALLHPLRPPFMGFHSSGRVSIGAVKPRGRKGCEKGTNLALDTGGFLISKSNAEARVRTGQEIAENTVQKRRMKWYGHFSFVIFSITFVINNFKKFRYVRCNSSMCRNNNVVKN